VSEKQPLHLFGLAEVVLVGVFQKKMKNF